MSKKIPASEYVKYDKYIEDEINLPIRHESKPYLMIPLPDGATNGDVIKALFYVKDVEELECCTFVSIAGDSDMRVYKDWWNAPYERR